MQEPLTDVVYIDETTFHLWMSPPRIWIKKGMRVEMLDLRGQSISVIRALSIQHGLILTHVFAGSNTVESFIPFIRELKWKCAKSKTIVVMDNLRVHHSKLLDQFF